MILRSLKGLARLAFAIAAINIVGLTQTTDGGPFNRPRSFDALNYKISTSFDKKARRIFGETTVTLRPLKTGLRLVELDSVGLRFSAVRLMPSEKALSFRVSKTGVSIDLDRAYGPDEEISIRLTYDSRPVSGVTFVPSGSLPERPGHSDQIWTQGEPEYSRHWFPSYDFPDDKATTEQILTVDADETAIANGELVSQELNANGKRVFHYRMPVPHSTYLTSFVIGKYVRLTDTHNGIPLNFYTYPGSEKLTRAAFAPTARMMEIFERLTGVPYPFNKYDQTIVAKFSIGGMENITATTLFDFDVFLVDRNIFVVEDLIAHELSHSWFGNLVTCRNWAELWINEGFATFMEAAYREAAFGKDEYLRKIRENAEIYFVEEASMKRKRGLYNRRARPDDSIFDGITYDKAGVVLHMLRRVVGDDAFWKGVKLILERHKFGVVETRDIRAAFEEASGRNLSAFFEQWVYGARYPRLEIEHSYRHDRGMLEIRVLQTQPADELTPAAFAFDLDVDIVANGKSERKTLPVTKRDETFYIPVASKPDRLKFDEDYDIPLKYLKVKNSDAQKKRAN